MFMTASMNNERNHVCNITELKIKLIKQIKPPYSKLILNVSNQELREVFAQHRENFGNSDFFKENISVLLYD